MWTVGGLATQVGSRGAVGLGRGGTASPTFFDRGGRVPHSHHFFGLKFVQKLVHCSNWLLTETQCKIISVQHVCRRKLFKNLYLSLVSGVPHFFFRTTPLVGSATQSLKRVVAGKPGKGNC